MRYVLLIIFLIIITQETRGEGVFNDGKSDTSKIIKTFFNDFSESVYGGWATFNPVSSRKTKPQINNEVLNIEINPGDYSTYSKKTERFELRKSINPKMGIRNKFKFRSKNKITNRVLISQISFLKRSSNDNGPIASVYLDRPPQCTTWHKTRISGSGKYFADVQRNEKVDTSKYEIFEDIVGLDDKYYLVTSGADDGLYQYQWRPSDKFNEYGDMNHKVSYSKLNDGKWHVVEMEVYPHETKGRCKIIIDGEVIFDIKNANTFTYLRNRSKHGSYSAYIGVYRGAVSYSQSVEFDDWTVSSFTLP